MMFEFNKEEQEELITFYKQKALHNADFDEISKSVHMVDKLTKKPPEQIVNIDVPKITEKKTVEYIMNRFTDIPLTFNYPTSRKIEYKIKSVNKEGHLYSKYKRLKLSIQDILNLKHIMNTQSEMFQTQNDWDQIGKTFGVKGGSLQTYAYNIDIGTFDKWIQKFLDTHECQTTLDKKVGC